MVSGDKYMVTSGTNIWLVDQEGLKLKLELNIILYS